MWVYYPRSVASSAARLIRSIDDLTLDAYTPFAVIVRRDIRLNVRTLEPFSLTRVLSGAQDINLQNDDFVYIFNRDEIRLLADAAMREQQGLLALQAQAGIATQMADGTQQAGGAINPQNGVPSGEPDSRSTAVSVPAVSVSVSGPAQPRTYAPEWCWTGTSPDPRHDPSPERSGLRHATTTRGRCWHPAISV